MKLQKKKSHLPNRKRHRILCPAPATRKLAEELSVPLEQVTGSGPKGQVLREDLIQYVKGAMLSSGKASSAAKKPAEVVFSKEDRREPLLGIKRIMFETMTYSHQNLPALYYFGKGESGAACEIAGGV